MIKFILNSDLHYNKDGIRPDKQDNVTKMLDLVKTTRIDAVIVPGDLTDVGSDGRGSCWCIDGRCKVLYEYDQLGELIDQFVHPIEQYSPIFMSWGNHDAYWSSIHTVMEWLCCLSTTRYPVLHYLEKKYGGLNYQFYIGSYHFICLGEYPDPPSFEYLKQHLTHDVKTILFFHFSLDSDYRWWPTEEKTAFYTYLQEYDSNIICIATGHHHETYDKMIDLGNGKQIRNINGAAETFLLCTIDEDGLLKTVVV
jgi:hypothetical protein